MEISLVHCHLRAQISSVGGHAVYVLCGPTKNWFLLFDCPTYYLVLCPVHRNKRQLFYTTLSFQMGLSLHFSWVAGVA